MRVVVNTLPLDTDLGSALMRAEAIGADALEVQCHVDHLVDTRARHVVVGSGFPCSGGVAIMANGRSLISPDKYVREYTIAYLSDCLHFIGDVGGSVLTVTPTQPSLPVEVSWEEAKSWCIEGLRRCADASESSGVGLSLEPINRYRTGFLNRCDQALELVAGLGPNYGVCPDLFHVLTEETDWRSAIRSTGSRLLNLQVAENTRRVPGRGAFQWDALIELLERMGYLGDIVIEMPRESVLPAPTGTGTPRRSSDRDIDTELAFGVERLRTAIASSPT